VVAAADVNAGVADAQLAREAPLAPQSAITYAIETLALCPRTFTSTLEGWTPPIGRLARLTSEPIAQRVECTAAKASGRMKSPLQTTEQRTCG